MTNELVTKKELNRYQRFARWALIFGFALMVLVDIALWVINETPDNSVILVALIPMAFTVVLAYLGREELAVWLFGAAFWGGVGYLTLTNPQSFMELPTLMGRYLFPLILLLPIAWFSFDQRNKRLTFMAIAFLASLSFALYGHSADTDIATTFTNNLLPIVYGMLIVSVLGIGFLVVRNSAELWRRFTNISLRYKLTIFMLVILVPTVLVSGLETARQAGDEMELANQQVLEESGSGLSETIEIWMSNTIQTLQALAETPAIVSMERQEQTPILEAFDENNPFVYLVHTINPQGMNVARSDGASPKDYSDRVYYLNSMAGDEITFQSVIGRSTGTPALVLGLPVREQSGRIVGVLSIALEFSSLTDAIGMTSIGETGTTFIVDENNTLIAHNDQSYFASQELVDFNSDPAVMALRNGAAGIIHYNDANGAERMAYVQELGEFGWGVIVTVEEAELQAPVRKMVNGTWQGFGFMLIPAVLLVWWVLGRTVQPISDLTSITEEYTAGNFSVRATAISDDEIGQLGRAFNQMAEEVGSQTMALAERAREMEASQRVTFAASERTTPDDFLNLLVNLIADQFDVYHCQVYLVDEEKNAAVLSQSTGYAGRQLLQRHHQIPLDAQSLVTQCIRTGEPVLVAETAKDTNWLPNPLLPYTQSELVVPLKVEDKVIGVMDIQDRVPERFTNETVPVFESMTEHVAFLYQNNALLEEIEQAQKTQAQFVRQLETTSEVAGQLTAILDPAQLLDQAVAMLQSRFNFYHAHIYLVDEAKEKLVVQSGSGNVGVILKERGHNIPVDAERSFVATAYRNAAPVRVYDTTRDPNWLPNPLLPDTRSEMAVPLITRGQVIGVLDIQDEVIGRFTEVDEDTMLTLAGQLATSVDTARLFEDVEHAAQRDRVRFEIANALAGNLTEDQVWDILLDKVTDNHIAVTFSLADRLEDGDIRITTHRSKSTDPAISPAPIGEQFLISENPVLAYLEPGEKFLSNDISTDERANPAIRDYLVSQGVVSLMAAPFGLAEDDEWQGMIRVSSREVGYFDANRASMYDALIELGTSALRAARLRAEAEQERERFRVLIESAPEAIVVFSGETGEFLEANKNAVELYELPMGQLIGNNPIALSPEFQPDGRPSSEAAMGFIQEAINGGLPIFDWVHRTGKGRDIPCEVRLVRLPGYDNPPRLRGSVTDISERAAAQQAIVQGDRLKSEFLANMSHELRTPLNSILGYTDVLLMGLDGELDEEVVTDLEAIHENSQHLLKLINDILDLAKIEAGRMTFELGDVNVHTLLNEVQKTSAGLMVNKAVQMVVEADENLPTVVADYHRVYQVVNNLVSNAVKFTEKGSITLKAFTEGDEMVLQVVDTGIGIAPEDLEAIFDEFTQADTSSTRQHEGTGLGLTITRRLVQMHGGTIHVESELGKGSTFSARFPLQAKVNPELLVVAQSSNGKK